MEPAADPIYTVSEITRQIKTALEQTFQTVRIKGELSNVRPASSGHLYFTIKDEDSVISAVMFRGRLRYLRFQPADGLLVLVKGNISVYNKRGTYQILCETMEPAGEGNILAMLEERKQRLAAEGLFALERKRPLPSFPSKIGVVTSPTGAAIRDILQVLKRRNTGLNLIILPAPVQGADAAPKIAAQIRRANIFGLGEVLIIGRGGGSLEDLLPFSDEEVVRAVADSDIPVISAVGHEIDTSLSDLAADMRAPTPSAAAELVTVRRDDLMDRIASCRKTVQQTMEQRLEKIRLLLGQFRAEQMERNFMMLLQPILMRLDDAKEGILRGMSDSVKDLRYRLSLNTGRLQASSPKGILERGYAIVRDSEKGEIIRDAEQTAPGKRIDVRFLRDSLTAQVEIIHSEELEQ